MQDNNKKTSAISDQSSDEMEITNNTPNEGVQPSNEENSRRAEGERTRGEDEVEPQGESTEGAVSEQVSEAADRSIADVESTEDEAEESTDDSEPSEPNGASVTDEPAQDDKDEQPKPAVNNDDPNAKWYVVHTYSGHENKVAATLRQRIESEHLQAKIFDILVPVQDKIEIKGGKKHEIKEKIFPGYILVKMVLEDNTWIAVRTTQGVTSFVGMGNKPTPISESEVQTIVRFSQIQQPTFKQIFMADDTVKIVDGPFAEFIGKVDSVDEEKGKVRVLVSIFGRETPVELDFLQVQKI